MNLGDIISTDVIVLFVVHTVFSGVTIRVMIIMSNVLSLTLYLAGRYALSVYVSH